MVLHRPPSIFFSTDMTLKECSALPTSCLRTKVHSSFRRGIWGQKKKKKEGKIDQKNRLKIHNCIMILKWKHNQRIPLLAKESELRSTQTIKIQILVPRVQVETCDPNHCLPNCRSKAPEMGLRIPPLRGRSTIALPTGSDAVVEMGTSRG